MENMVIKLLFEKIDELKPLIKRAYETASGEERLLLDQVIPEKFHAIEQWLPGLSIDTMWQDRKG
jgi:hypothetical protein